MPGIMASSLARWRMHSDLTKIILNLEPEESFAIRANHDLKPEPSNRGNMVIAFDRLQTVDGLELV